MSDKGGMVGCKGLESGRQKSGFGLGAGYRLSSTGTLPEERLSCALGLFQEETKFWLELLQKKKDF